MAGALRAPWLWRGPDSACVQWGGSMGSEVAEVVQDDVRLSWTQAGGQGKGDPREEGVACWLVESGPRQARSAGPSSMGRGRATPGRRASRAGWLRAGGDRPGVPARARRLTPAAFLF